MSLLPVSVSDHWQREGCVWVGRRECEHDEGISWPSLFGAVYFDTEFVIRSPGAVVAPRCPVLVQGPTPSVGKPVVSHHVRLGDEELHCDQPHAQPCAQLLLFSLHE